MSNTEINRQIVQQGLDRRAAHKKQMEASLEDQARMLRHTISDNHTTKRDTARLKQEAIAEEQARQQAERKAKYEAKMATYQAREKLYCSQFLARAFTPMILAVVFVKLFLIGKMSMVAALTVAALCFTLGLKYMFEYLFG